MRRALEAALDRAEDVIESVQQRPPKRRSSSCGEKSLHDKLYDLYVEECAKEPEVEGLRSSVNLLEKLVRRESLPCLVVNLYPGNQGYSLMLGDSAGSFSETIPLPYARRELLEYLDAEELPPVLLDVLEASEVNLFHGGCVIAEIRDYRQCSNMEPPGYQSRHILLRPTMQTLVCDVQSMAGDDHQWTEEEKLERESQLNLATAEPLCLDPSAMACTANRLLYDKQQMKTAPMTLWFKRRSSPPVILQPEPTQCPTLPDLEVWSACKKRAENKASRPYHLQISAAGRCVDTWKQRPCDLAVPSEVDLLKYAKGKPSTQSDDPQRTVWPAPEVNDFLFECEAGSLPWEVKESVVQSLNDPFLSGSFKNIHKPQPLKEARGECQPCLRPMLPGACSDVFPAGWTEAGCTVGVGHECVPSRAEGPGKMSHGSGGSASLSRPSSGEQPTRPAAPGPRVRATAAALPLVPGSGQSSSGVGDPLPAAQAGRSPKFPRLAPEPLPAPRPAGLAQPTWVRVCGVSTLPPARPPATSSESVPATQGPASSSALNVFHVVGPAQGAPVRVSGSHGALGRPAGGPAPRRVPGSGFLPPGAQLPGAQPGTTQPYALAAVHVIVNNTSAPLTLQLPPGSFILNPQPPSQSGPPPLSPLRPLPPPQPWAPPRPRLYQLIPQHQMPRPWPSPPEQPAPPGSARGSSCPQWAVNLTGAGRLLQPQAAVLCPPRAACPGPGPSPPGQRCPLSAAAARPPAQAHNAQPSCGRPPRLGHAAP